MSSNVFQMHTSAAEQLRAIADMLDSGELDGPVMVLTNRDMYMCAFPWAPERVSVEASWMLQRSIFQLHAVGSGVLEIDYGR